MGMRSIIGVFGVCSSVSEPGVGDILRDILRQWSDAIYSI